MEFKNIFVSAVSQGGTFPLSGILECLEQASATNLNTFFDFNCWISKAVFDELSVTSNSFNKEKGLMKWDATSEHSKVALVCFVQKLGNYVFFKVTKIQNGKLKYFFKGSPENKGPSGKNVFFLTVSETIVFK